MSTRGLVGVRWGKRWNGTYNHSDSYPSYLGAHVVELASKLSPEDVKKMKANLKTIKWINPEKELELPTQEQLKELEDAGFLTISQELKELQDQGINSGQEQDWYWTFRDIQGEECFEWVLKGIPYLLACKEFINSSLYCEYAYILDLNRSVLEFYKGYQKVYVINVELPYGTDSKRIRGKTYYKDDISTYYYGPCKKVGELPFNNLDGWQKFYKDD